MTRRIAVTAFVLGITLAGCASTSSPESHPNTAGDCCCHSEYPPAAALAGLQGTTRVTAYVDASGAVTRTEIAATSGYDILDSAAQRSVASCRFRPAMKSGIPVEGSITMNYVWKLQ